MIPLSQKEKRLSWFFYLPLYFIGARYLLSMMFSLLIKFFQLNIPQELLNPWFNVFYDFILMLVGIWCFKDYLSYSLQKAKGKWFKIIFWSLTIGFLILYLVNIATGLMIALINPQAGSANQEMIEMMTEIAPFQMIVSSVFLAPVLEELVFRVGIFQALYENHRILAYGLSSLAFGSVHIVSGLFAGDLTQLLFLIPYSTLGAVFCYLYEKKETIFVPMLVHGANNLFSMLMILFL